MNLKNLNKIFKHRNVIYMFPSEEYCRNASIGRWVKKDSRRVIEENGFIDFCLSNADAYKLMKNWFSGFQFLTIAYPKCYRPDRSILYDYSDGYLWKWGFLTDHFKDIDVQYPEWSATILIKSVSAYIRTNFHQYKDDLHQMRVDYLNQMSEDVHYVLSDTPELGVAMTYVDGKKVYVDVSGHAVNMVLLSGFTCLDIYGWKKQIERNFSDFKEITEFIETPETPSENKGVLWHTKKDNLFGVEAGMYIANILGILKDVKNNAMALHGMLERLRYPKCDAIFRTRLLRYDFEGDWRTILTLWISRSISENLYYYENNYKDILGKRSLFESFRYNVSFKVENIKVALDTFEGINLIIDVGGGDSSKMLVKFLEGNYDRMVLDLNTGFDLNVDYRELEIYESRRDVLFLFSDVLHHIENMLEVLDWLDSKDFNLIIYDHLVERGETNYRTALDQYHMLGGFDVAIAYPNSTDISGFERIPIEDRFYSLRRIMCVNRVGQ
jgi:hypothetical protein